MQGARDGRGGSDEMRNSYQEDRISKGEGDEVDPFGYPGFGPSS